MLQSPTISTASGAVTAAGEASYWRAVHAMPEARRPNPREGRTHRRRQTLLLLPRAQSTTAAAAAAAACAINIWIRIASKISIKVGNLSQPCS
jgi:hypothetical protein